jgi:hypothetical protein
VLAVLAVLRVLLAVLRVLLHVLLRFALLRFALSLE